MKLDGVGLVGNRPSTEKLKHFVEKKREKIREKISNTWYMLHIRDMWRVTCSLWLWVNLLSNYQVTSSYCFGVACDMWHVTPVTWQMICDMWLVTPNTWQMICDMWHISCVIWHVSHDMQGLVNILTQCQVPSSNGLGVSCLTDPV